MSIPLIYLAAKYTEIHPYLIQRNIDRARLCAQEVALLGCCPMTPPLIGSHFEGIQDYLWWGEAYMNLLRRCDGVFMVPGYQNSNGAMKELTEALRLEMPVFYSLTDLQDWINSQSPAPITLPSFQSERS